MESARRDTSGRRQLMKAASYYAVLPFTIYDLRLTVHSFLDSSDPVNHSVMNLASIQNEIETLDSAERAALIDVLWDSLDEERIKEIEAKWAAESEERIGAFDRGELTAVDGPSALEELHSSLRK